jgi:hypothetical protein
MCSEIQTSIDEDFGILAKSSRSSRRTAKGLTLALKIILVWLVKLQLVHDIPAP